MFLESETCSMLTFFQSETHSVLTFLKSDTYSFLSIQCLSYVGKFDSQAALGIYGLTAPTDTKILLKLYNHVALNINTAHTLYNVAMTTLWLQPIYGFSLSTVD